MSEELQADNLTDLQKQFYVVIGGIRVANRIREAIGSQTMAALTQIQEKKLYLAEGYPNFVEFLDKSPYSPMGKNKYYRLQEFYKSEQPEEFDLLNSVNPAVAERRLLTAGDISLDGDQVIVGDTPYQISDKKGIKKAITRLIEHVKIKEAEAAKSEKEIAKKDKQLKELEAAPPSALPDSEASLITQGITRIAAGFSDLIAGVRELSADDLKAFKKKHARRIDSIVEAYGEFLTTHKPTARAAASVEADEDEFTDEELAQIMED